jgi:uncharacterized protein DUF3616
MPTELLRQPTFALRAPASATGEVPEKRRFRSCLSALAFADGGRTLFLGGDETVEATPTIERLVRDDRGDYGEHESFDVSDFFDLPDDEAKKGRVGEIDIEGLAEAGGYLWLIGSHCSIRKKPKGRSIEEDIARLARLEVGANRLVLGCIPLEVHGSGSVLVAASEGRRAARLRTDLRKLLRNDPHLGPFLIPIGTGRHAAVLPGKDNGLDLEGLSVRAEEDGTFRLFLGLRGPVLRGWAMVLELLLGVEKRRLTPKVFAASGLPYRKHFLDLSGLGVRDLAADGEDLLILAGPTMVLDGPVAVFRWRPALESSSGDTLTPQGSGALERVFDVPHGPSCDHAEGLAKLPDGVDGAELMVVYDKPSAARQVGEHGVRADVFRL